MMMSRSSLSFHLRRQLYLGGLGYNPRPGMLPASTARDTSAASAGHLRQVIDDRQLSVLFQPIVDLARGRFSVSRG